MSVIDEVVELSNNDMAVDEISVFKGIKRKTVVDYISKWKRIQAKEGFIKYEGDDCPVDEEVKVQITMRNARKETKIAKDVCWEMIDSPYDVMSYRVVDEIIEEIEENEEVEFLQAQIKKLNKSRQTLMDSNRMLRAQNRNEFRSESTLEEIGNELIEANKNASKRLIPFSKVPALPTMPDKGILQLSDLHFNEIIDMEFNQYNPEIFERRIRYFVQEAIQEFTSRNITEVYLVNTGDVMNSLRRKSEITNCFTNRSEASILLQDILIKVILELRNHFAVNVVSVQGNESRLEEDWDSTNFLCSDGFDYIVFANIEQQFKFANIENVNFLSLDKLEYVFDVNGVNILATHDCSRFTSTQSKAQSKIGGYYLMGKHVDFIISGHIHQTLISDYSSRSSSIVGTNEYAWHKLGLTGKASQNLYVVKADKNIIKICVELQNA